MIKRYKMGLHHTYSSITNCSFVAHCSYLILIPMSRVHRYNEYKMYLIIMKDFMNVKDVMNITCTLYQLFIITNYHPFGKGV